MRTGPAVLIQEHDFKNLLGSSAGNVVVELRDGCAEASDDGHSLFGQTNTREMPSVAR